MNVAQDNVTEYLQRGYCAYKLARSEGKIHYSSYAINEEVERSHMFWR